ncbi:MAG TPA: nucleotidyltransferase family protein, partial [Clostridia bacterium]|nr:nucleotidyltransferase family protein [Clostridia bacterium]
MDKINALILAGDSGKGELASSLENKSFIEIKGKWMVEYVVDALRDCSMVGEICIIGPHKHLEERLGDRIDYYFEAHGDMLENLERGLSAFKGDPTLVVTSDIPMIDGEVVLDFIQRCRSKEADLYYPIVKKEVNDEKYPGFQRTYVRMKEGVFTGGNMMLLNPRIVDKCTQFIKDAIDNRKNPWKLGRMLGFHFLIMLALGILSIARVEKRFLKLLDIKACAIISPFPQLANDVDKFIDIKLT